MGGEEGKNASEFANNQDKEEHKEMEEVLEPELEALLQTDTSTGLTDAEVAIRLEKWGKNRKLID